MFYKQFIAFMNTMYTLRANSLKRIHSFHVVHPLDFITIISLLAMIIVIVAFLSCDNQGGSMKKEHVKPVLLSAAQVAALKAIQEQERQKSGFGIAPSIHDVARKIFDVGLSRMEVSQ
ncbi:hypothetical protein V6S19_02455 [Klebsiella pneumoniae]